MVEFFSGLATGYLLTWPALVVLLLLGTLAEHSESSGWAVFLTLVTGALGLFYLHVPIKEVGWYALAYFGIGILWSFYRYRRYVKQRLKKIARTKENIASLAPSMQTEQIVVWIIVWPLSLLDVFIGSFLDFFRVIVSSWLKSIYTRIYNSALKGL